MIKFPLTPPVTSIRFVICLGLATCLYLLLSVLLSASFPAVSRIQCTVELEQTGAVQFFYWNGLRKDTFQQKYSRTSKAIGGGEKMTIALHLPNAPVQAVRLDLGSSEGSIKLYQLLISSHFTKDRLLNASDIYQMFKAGNAKVSMQMADDHVVIISRSNDPFIISTAPLLKRPLLLTLGLPALLASLFFSFLYKTDWSNAPPCADLRVKSPTTGANIAALDGLRGLAALMVVADHCYGRFTGLGTGGVWIFMVLSGFLLTKPFTTDHGRVRSMAKMRSFYSRRLRRVLPAYYTYIIVVYLVTTRFDLALRHFLFLQGAGHLWVIPQEILFYLLIPLVLLLNSVVLRGNSWLCALFVVSIAVAANSLLTVGVFSMYGLANENIRLYAGVFFTGVSCAYLYHSLYPVLAGIPNHKKSINSLCSFCGLSLLLLFLLGSTGRLWGGKTVYAQVYFEWFGAAAGLLLLCIVFSERSLLNKLLAWTPLRAIGMVSLSLYLVHPLVIGMLTKGMRHYTDVALTGLPLFFSTALLSYLIAVATYTFIEKPFVK